MISPSTKMNETKHLFVYACHAGRLDLVKPLVEKGLTVDDIRSYGNEPMMHACRNGHLDIVKYLISKGLSLDDVRKNDNQALHCACADGHLDIVKYLVSLGLTLDDLQSCDNRALNWACSDQHLDVVKYLSVVINDLESNDSNVDSNADDQKPLKFHFGHGIGYQFASAMKSRNLNWIKQLVGQGLTLDNIRHDNNWALRYACNNNHLDVARYLVEQGLTLDDIQSCDNQALNLACSDQRLDVVKYLVLLIDQMENGNNDQSIDSDNESTNVKHDLMKEAVKTGNVDILQFLIDNESVF